MKEIMFWLFKDPIVTVAWLSFDHAQLNSKKSETCKEGVAHLRISLWYLLMNFEKPKKSEFWQNEKKLLEISSCYLSVTKTTIIWGIVPEIEWDKFFLSFWAIFCPKKRHLNYLEMSSFYTCATKNMIKWCMLTQIWSATDIIFCHFRPFFALASLLTLKIKIWKKVYI